MKVRRVVLEKLMENDPYHKVGRLSFKIGYIASITEEKHKMDDASLSYYEGTREFDNQRPLIAPLIELSKDRLALLACIRQFKQLDEDFSVEIRENAYEIDNQRLNAYAVDCLQLLDNWNACKNMLLEFHGDFYGSSNRLVSASVEEAIVCFNTMSSALHLSEQSFLRYFPDFSAKIRKIGSFLLKSGEPNENRIPIENSIKLLWRNEHGSKSELAEVVWALAKSRRIINSTTGQPVTMDELTSHFEGMFGISLNTMGLMQGRKRSSKAYEDGTTFMAYLSDLVNQYLE